MHRNVLYIKTKIKTQRAAAMRFCTESVGSPAVSDEAREYAGNPKRIQREAKRQMQCIGIGTKSQQALQMQREQMKTEREQLRRENREAEKQRQFDLKQQKRKEKHRGR